jgi:hypothetical protein
MPSTRRRHALGSRIHTYIHLYTKKHTHTHTHNYAQALNAFNKEKARLGLQDADIAAPGKTFTAKDIFG